MGSWDEINEENPLCPQGDTVIRSPDHRKNVSSLVFPSAITKLAAGIGRFAVFFVLPVLLLTVLILTMNPPQSSEVAGGLLPTCDVPILADILPLTKEEKKLRDPFKDEEIKGPYPHLCVLARTQPDMYRYLPAFLSSWTQMPMNASVLLVVTQKDKKLDVLEAVVKSADALGGKGAVDVLSITEADARKATPERHRNSELYGFDYTDAAIDMLLDKKRSPRKCQYLLITDAVNLYSRHLPRHVVTLMKQDLELIGFDFVSASAEATPTADRSQPGVYDSGAMKCTEAQFNAKRMELGAMVLSSKFLQRTGMKFLYPALTKLEMAAGAFAERAGWETDKTALIAQTLAMHQ